MARKYIQQKPQNRTELFDAVVKNAITFVDSAIETLDRRPKNSIVEFYTAVELFLKARLMAEHWSLIISKPENASLDSFSVGDFQSVYLDEAAKRLKDIVGEPLDEKALANFRALGEHRNQIVHFAHTDYPDVSGAKAGIAVELWASWHYLHAFLVGTWANTFAAYLNEFTRLDGRMTAQAEFVRVRFNAIGPRLQEHLRTGDRFVTCNHCRMAVGLVQISHKWGSDYRCLVCDTIGTATLPTSATVQCDSCGSDFEFFNREALACPTCNKPVDTDARIGLCRAKFKERDAWCEEGGPNVAECHVCHHRRPSVFYVEELWSCVSCFERGWQAATCPHCGEFVTGDMERIKYVGCFKCEDSSLEHILGESR